MQVLHLQLVLDQVMLGLILIQAVFLFFMMDTGSKQEQLLLDLLVRKVLLDQLAHKEFKDQQVPQVLVLLAYRGG
jgi:hypothetical protein